MLPGLRSVGAEAQRLYGLDVLKPLTPDSWRSFLALPCRDSEMSTDVFLHLWRAILLSR